MAALNALTTCQWIIWHVLSSDSQHREIATNWGEETKVADLALNSLFDSTLTRVYFRKANSEVERWDGSQRGNLTSQNQEYRDWGLPKYTHWCQSRCNQLNRHLCTVQMSVRRTKRQLHRAQGTRMIARRRSNCVVRRPRHRNGRVVVKIDGWQTYACSFRYKFVHGRNGDSPRQTMPCYMNLRRLFW